MKQKIAVALVSLGFIAAVGLTSVSAQSSQDATVNVTVNGKTELDVRPTALTYNQSGGLNPGNAATASDEYNGYETVVVENIGSNNITEVIASASQPSSNPFGSGTTSSYDAGNFIEISTATVNNGSYSGENFISAISGGTDENFHYVNRVEFENDPTPSYIETLGSSENGKLQFSSNIGSGDIQSDVGRFRVGDEWYYYAVYYDGTAGSGACDGTTSGDAELWVGNTAHTPTSTGTTDLSSTSTTSQYDIENAQGNVGVTNSTVSYSVTNSTGGTETVKYSVYTKCSGSDSATGATLRTRFNTDPDFEAASETDITFSDSGDTHILDATSGEELNPGDYFPVDVTVEVPQGVVNGDINGGTLTLEALTT